MDNAETQLFYIFVSIVGIVVTIITAWILLGYPKWRVWASHQEGLAELMLARNEQQVQVAQAQGRVDAAELNKQAAVIEAQAVALQIEAIGKQLTAHDLYLKWQWIKMMEERPESSTIYVPTEANIPILEATRLTEIAGSKAEWRMAKPKPKFRVGQVVAWHNGGVAKINRIGSIPYEHDFVYWVSPSKGGYVPEHYLRPLTAREIGQPRKPRRRKK